MHVDLIPNSQLIACHVIGGACTSKRRDGSSAGMVKVCMPEARSHERSGKWWRSVGSRVRSEDAMNDSVGQ